MARDGGAADAAGAGTSWQHAGMRANLATPAEFVRSVCRLGPVPMVSEIRLYLSGDVLDLWQQTEDRAGPDQPPPFWAFPWPGGQVLARYVLDHPGLVAGRRVLDLGSGSGLVAIAAAKAGAAEVLASEIDPVAAAAIRLNALANDVPPPQVTGDVLDGDGERADVVLAGDIWYAQPLAGRALRLIERAVSRGAWVLAGDIGRVFLPRGRFRVLETSDVPVVADLEDADIKTAMVLAPGWPAAAGQLPLLPRQESGAGPGGSTVPRDAGSGAPAAIASCLRGSSGIGGRGRSGLSRAGGGRGTGSGL
jgi:predicted nicotinamide N-methyase